MRHSLPMIRLMTLLMMLGLVIIAPNSAQAAVYTLTVTAVGSGSVELDPAGGSYDEGTKVTITASADANYHFTAWSEDDDDTSSNNPLIITVTSDMDIQANFDIDTFTLTMAKAGTGDGTVTPDVGPHTYDYGEKVNIVADPAASSTFAGWSGAVKNPGATSTTVTMDGDKIVTANFDIKTFTLTMAKAGTGDGTVAPDVGPHTYDYGTVVNLTATPADNSAFDGWSGAVANPGATSTTVTMDGDKIVTANFDIKTFTLTMAKAGTGDGTVTPDVGPHTYDYGEKVNIVADPAASSTFAGWSGAVKNPGATSTTVTMDGDKIVTANFIQIMHTLTMQVSGSGSTTPSAGAHGYAEDAVVPITAAAASGWQFVNWSGDVANPNSASTTVTMDGDKTVTANFTQIMHTLTMQVSGSGSTTPPVGGHEYAEDAVVPITASADSSWQFVNWSGGVVADPNSASTTVTMNSSKTVTANFDIKTFTLTMAKAGTGDGTVAPDVDTYTYDYGEKVNIEATPAVSSTFAGWSGAVANPGATSTTVTMDGDKTVTANFDIKTFTLTMAKDGTGDGTITPDVGPHTYDYGEKVNIVADPAASSTFAGWSGTVANPGATSTTVTMDGDKIVTANFDIKTFTLTMVKAGTGDGTIAPDVGPHTYDYGTVVNLTATPADNSAFDGWSSGVAAPDSATTTVTIDSNKTVTANFVPTYSLTVNPEGSGSVVLNPSGGTYIIGTSVALTADAAPGWMFSEWGDDLTGSENPTTIEINSDKSVTATFVKVDVWHVDNSVEAEAPRNGNSWETAFETIQAAIDAASDGVVVDEIWVKGEYYLSNQINVYKAVEIYGGFAGTETDRDERNWKANETTVDGNDKVRCFYVTADATIDGFTITNGSEKLGGAMVLEDYLPIITNCTFLENIATRLGGAIFNNDSDPTITNCTFSYNTAGAGGGIYNDSSDATTITNCTFSYNTAEGGGGGIYNDFSDATTITNCTFSYNTAEGGGGIYNGDSNPTITNCIIYGNTVTGESYGGGGLLNVYSDATITNCTIVKNTVAGESYGGGGICNVEESSPTITNCIIRDNTAPNGHEEIYNDDGSSADVTYSDVEGGYENDIDIIDEDPLFVDPDNGDYHLQAGSPCIDVGLNDAVDVPTDFEGDPRILDGTVDMGADEAFVSSTGSGGGGGGCFIATAAFGSLVEPHVQVLRDFRDCYLLTNTPGKIFVDLYYTYSPPIADFIAEHDALRMVIRWSLLPLVGVSYVALHFGAGAAFALVVLLLALMSATTWAVVIKRRGANHRLT